jgi:hypothetical protein
MTSSALSACMDEALQSDNATGPRIRSGNLNTGAMEIQAVLPASGKTEHYHLISYCGPLSETDDEKWCNESQMLHREQSEK